MFYNFCPIQLNLFQCNYLDRINADDEKIIYSSELANLNRNNFDPDDGNNDDGGDDDDEEVKEFEPVDLVSHRELQIKYYFCQR